MLNLLDESLEAFLRAEVPLSPRAVDIAFDAPDRDWGARVTKPTVNLFLRDVRRNLSGREAGMELDEENGRPVRRQPRPRVDCRYLVTAWTTEPNDEHALLGAVLATLLQHREVPTDYLQGAYAPVRPPPALSVAAADGRDQSEFWSALGGQLKPGLDIVVTATVDAAVTAEAGPPVERYDVEVADRDGGARSRTSYVAGRAGGDPEGLVVRSRRGRALVGPDGSFLLRAEAGDEVVVEDGESRSRTVPEQGHIEDRDR